MAKAGNIAGDAFKSFTNLKHGSFYTQSQRS